MAVISYILNLLTYVVMWLIIFYIHSKIRKPLLKILHLTYSKTIKPHINKTRFIFTFIITLFIAGTISLVATESIGFTRLWPYQMTFLTFILGWESYRMYKRTYPTPLNYQIDSFLATNHPIEGGPE